MPAASADGTGGKPAIDEAAGHGGEVRPDTAVGDEVTVAGPSSHEPSSAADGAAGPGDEAATPADSSQPPRPSAPVADCGPLLKKTFPALFAGGPKPLKLRIQIDIQERAPGVFSKQALSAFFRRYTGSTSYLIAVSRAKNRFDLDGAPAGELSDEHRKIALDEIARRRGNTESRAALEEQQRRNRATLLHDFERTTLTPANFCALKGVAVDELEGFLATARREAAERPPNPRPFEGRGGPPDRGDGRPVQAAPRPHPRDGRPGRPGPGDARPGQPARGDGRPAPAGRGDVRPAQADAVDGRPPKARAPTRPDARPADAGRSAPRRR